MAIHYAKLENSPRLQRVFNLLSGGRAYSTRDIIRLADVCAVNTIIEELRENGFDISCTQVGRGHFEYQLKGKSDETSPA